MHIPKLGIFLIVLSILFSLSVSAAYIPSFGALTVYAQTPNTSGPDFGLGSAVQGTPLQKNGKLSDAVAKIILAVLQFVAAAFLVLIIYGGMRWMMSGGNEKSVETAKKIITSAAIGLAIVMLGYSIAYFVVSSITNAVNDQPTGQCDPNTDPNC